MADSRSDGWRVLTGDELREFCAGLSTSDARSEVERLQGALTRVARFSHNKDFSHHGVEFDECDRESCADARAEIQRLNRRRQAIAPPPPEKG